jgi:hypothetical protein
MEVFIDKDYLSCIELSSLEVESLSLVEVPEEFSTGHKLHYQVAVVVVLKGIHQLYYEWVVMALQDVLFIFRYTYNYSINGNTVEVLDLETTHNLSLLYLLHGVGLPTNSDQVHLPERTLPYQLQRHDLPHVHQL